MTVSDVAEEFDLCGPLPTGVIVLEASAGTGKTYTIAGLAARYVADGTPLDELLIVTFTRAAAAELRERVRGRLATAHDSLSAALLGRPPDDRDRLAVLLAEGTPSEVGERRDRLAAALADFDAATITTIHGFCRDELHALGMAGDLDPRYTFSPNARDTVEEVLDDVYVEMFLDRQPSFGRKDALEVALKVVEHPSVELAPAPSGGQPDGTYLGDLLERARQRHELATRVRHEVERRKRAAGVMTYNDLLTRLRGTLEGPEGHAVMTQMRARHQVVLVDEFQDTDPDQWMILKRAFAEGGKTLVLIGDPKQAIYAFRGADVHAYLDARSSATARPTLRENRRSDQPLIDAYDALFAGAALGHPDIVYRDVRAVEANRTSRLIDAPDPHPLRLRVVSRDAPGIETGKNECATPKSARVHVAHDVAADVVELLRSGARIERRHDDGTPCEQEPVKPGHIAVLCRTNPQVGLIKKALEAAGVPAVINGAGSVFTTDAATAWLHLLEALEQPESQARVRTAAMTPFLDWSFERLAAIDDNQWDDLHQQVRRWAATLQRSGMAALMETITSDQALPGKVLAHLGGERVLTDLRHVSELLHATAVEEQLGITALAAWLRRRIAVAAQEHDDESSSERTRRLESDAAAVQVLTVHRSKGLEFPIVYCPFLWDPMWIPYDVARPVIFRENGNDGRALDVSMEREVGDCQDHQDEDRRKQLDEELRLAYVALTRARHQAIVWWAGTGSSRDSPLSRLVFDRVPGSAELTKQNYTPTDDWAYAAFEALRNDAVGDTISVDWSSSRDVTPWEAPAPERAGLKVAVLDRTMDARWRRTSYSAIVGRTHEAPVGSELEEPVGADDDPRFPRPAAGHLVGGPGEDEGLLRALPSPLSAMPAGARIGTFVHRVLEGADFAAEDLDLELDRQIAGDLRRRSIDVGDPVALRDGLRAAIETPLGELVGGRRLRDLPPADRLNELSFDLPLVGGDRPTGVLTVAAIAKALREHVAEDDPMAGYVDRLADPALRSAMQGYLTGTIDLLARSDAAAGEPRFMIIDYKTNRLAAPQESLTAWHHRPSVVAAEMWRSHYALQALLYSVAVHRYLRWRMPSYDPDRDRPAVLYLFLRGMLGATTPAVDGTPCGVFAWRPPVGLIAALSDVLDGDAE
jgi:exodeoxyribonuclease V beta subunit